MSREQFAEMLIPTIFILKIVLTLLMCKKEQKSNKSGFFLHLKSVLLGPDIKVSHKTFWLLEGSLPSSKWPKPPCRAAFPRDVIFKGYKAEASGVKFVESDT